MQALLIDTRADRLDQNLIALMKAGIHVTGTSSLAVAETCIMRMGVDLLIVDKETIGDALGDTLGMAEDRNPYLVSVLRTPYVDSDHDELPPHFPSLHCIIGQDVPNRIALKIGLSSLREQLSARLASTSPKSDAMPKPLPETLQQAAIANQAQANRRLTLFADMAKAG